MSGASPNTEARRLFVRTMTAGLRPGLGIVPVVPSVAITGDVGLGLSRCATPARLSLPALPFPGVIAGTSSATALPLRRALRPVVRGDDARGRLGQCMASCIDATVWLLNNSPPWIDTTCCSSLLPWPWGCSQSHSCSVPGGCRSSWRRRTSLRYSCRMVATDDRPPLPEPVGEAFRRAALAHQAQRRSITDPRDRATPTLLDKLLASLRRLLRRG
jgi:hypothetical protein